MSILNKKIRHLITMTNQACDGKFLKNRKSLRLATRQENKSFDLTEKAHLKRAKARNRDLVGVIDNNFIKDVNIQLNPKKKVAEKPEQQTEDLRSFSIYGDFLEKYKERIKVCIENKTLSVNSDKYTEASAKNFKQFSESLYGYRLKIHKDSPKGKIFKLKSIFSKCESKNGKHIRNKSCCNISSPHQKAKFNEYTTPVIHKGPTANLSNKIENFDFYNNISNCKQNSSKKFDKMRKLNAYKFSFYGQRARHHKKSISNCVPNTSNQMQDQDQEYLYKDLFKNTENVNEEISDPTTSLLKQFTTNAEERVSKRQLVLSKKYDISKMNKSEYIADANDKRTELLEMIKSAQESSSNTIKSKPSPKKSNKK